MNTGLTKDAEELLVVIAEVFGDKPFTSKDIVTSMHPKLVKWRTDVATRDMLKHAARKNDE